ncbi:N-acetylglucosaminyldiphosphodolichol N-acetylglucosaminyltransferase catalytic subunit alg13 [Madurella fahalii]|uniref:UDP-N-acetylglucosamine transferase subunit ALG13 n=1 Tax=Madurella fahalii TaxID=1157608 RepID=A0ABQ0GEQ8_9PEZI
MAENVITWVGRGPAITNGNPGATTVTTTITIMVEGVGAGASGEPQHKRQRVDGRDDQTNLDAEHPSLPGRRCFVTVGATASFRALIEEVSSPSFLQCLAEHGYTRLDVQCGPDYQLFEQRINSLRDEDKHGIEIGMFAYTDAMADYMLACRGEIGVRPAGCVISHGGSGTVLEAMRVEAPLIVVVNPTLMDNHQLELAQSLADQNWAVHGQIGNLPAAITRITERIVQGTLDALPPYAPPSFPVPAAERVTLFDWMVLTCYPGELQIQQRLAELADVQAHFQQQQQQQEQQQQLQQQQEQVPLTNGNHRYFPIQEGGYEDLRLD